MKKHIIKVVTLLLFTSVVISSCEVGYQERRMHRYDSNRRDHYNRYDNRYDNHYDRRYDNDNYHRY